MYNLPEDIVCNKTNEVVSILEIADLTLLEQTSIYSLDLQLKIHSIECEEDFYLKEY